MAVDFYDAINLFKFSPTGQGSPRNGRNPYPQLAADVLRKLWHLLSDGEIGYEQLPPELDAVSYEHGRIAVNTRYRTQLAETSFLLVHEGAHLVRAWRYVDEELRCRYLETCFYEDLLGGVWIHLRARGQTSQRWSITSRSLMAQMEKQKDYLAKHQLVDYLLSQREYLDSITAQWVRERFNEWGRIGNRWGRTKGHYIRLLAAEGGNHNAELVLRIMRSIDRREQWDNMMSVIRQGNTLLHVRDAFAPLMARADFARDVSVLKLTWDPTLDVLGPILR